MSALDPFRNELRALLGDGVLLRRDQAMRALFVCDAPRRVSEPAALKKALMDAGFTVDEEAALWRIDLSAARRQTFIAGLRPGHPPQDLRLRSLCRSLRAQGEPAPESQPWPLIRQTLLRLDAGDTDRLAREMAAQVALLKRMHAPLPLAAAYLIEENQAEGGSPC